MKPEKQPKIPQEDLFRMRLEKARENLVKLSKEHGIKLRQNYNRFGPQYVLMASRYAHAKQFKRMKKMNNKLKSRLGRVKRDIERQLTNYSVDIQSLFEVALEQAQKLIEQEQHSKNKLYSLHAPEVECISKGKVHKPYEFGVKDSNFGRSFSNASLTVMVLSSGHKRSALCPWHHC